jgi:hypothetical protein
MEMGEGIDLPCPGCCSADVNGSDSPFSTEDDGATGQGLEVTGMANLDPRNICNGIEPLHSGDIIKKEEEVSMIPFLVFKRLEKGYWVLFVLEIGESCNLIFWG